MRNRMIAHSDAAGRRAVIYPPGVIPPVEGMPTVQEATSAMIYTRRELSFFTEAESLCEDLQGRLHAAAQELLHELFDDIDAQHPFDLMTGEIVSSRPWDGEVLRQGKIPKPKPKL